MLLGLVLLLLPLLAAELSRPRDSFWGAVVLLLGLDLVTCADRLTGAPMLGVLCGGLLIGRLGLEVAQTRWFRLTPEEQQKLLQLERWQTLLGQLGEAVGRMLALVAGGASGAVGWLQRQRQPRTSGKRWVRPEAPVAATGNPDTATGAEPGSEPVVGEGASALAADAGEGEPAGLEAPDQSAVPEQAAVTVIASLEEVEALIDADDTRDNSADSANGDNAEDGETAASAQAG